MDLEPRKRTDLNPRKDSPSREDLQTDLNRRFNRKPNLDLNSLTRNDDLPPVLNRDLPEEFRVKSSLRLQYEAQVRVIRGQIGDLEKVRRDLGLSQRKISQLLLVDPSAWTRWTRDGESESAPPHIWRALQWYLTVKEKIPGLTPQYFLGSDPKVLNEKTLKKLDDERSLRQSTIHALEKRLAEVEANYRNEMRTLTEQTRRLRKWGLFWAGMTCSLLTVAAVIFLRKF